VSTTPDLPGRPLSGPELADRAVLAPALKVWTRYLSRMGWAPTYPVAAAKGLAVELADRGCSELTAGVRVAVHPPFAQVYWATRMAPEGRVDAVSLTMLVEALRFMGAQEMGRFSPVGENPPVFPRIRAVTGWWHLGREVQRRLHQGLYVPVLTATPGRRRAGSARPVPGRAGPLRVVADPASTVNLLRDFTRPDRATALLGVAVTDARPLCTRRAGRPGAAGSAALSLVTDSVLVHLVGLSSYAERHRGRLGLAAGSPSAIRDALPAAGQGSPGLLTVVRSFSTVDSGGPRRRVGDWWRVRLAALRHPEVDWDVLVGEVAGWRTARSMGATADAVAVAELEGLPRMPRGNDPEDVFPDVSGVYVFESERAEMSREERALRGLLYPGE